jgi:predicted RNA-binding Zn ribbon-like protein
VAVRAAIRELLGAHHDREPAPPAATGVLNDATRRARPQVVFGGEGWRLEVAAGGLDAALGRLAVIIAATMQDGTWPRLKLCTNQACQWAFYDASRAQTARWCSMQICGNRAKQRAWRHRQAGQLPPGDRA